MLALPACAVTASTLQAISALKAVHFPPGNPYVTLLD
jgi:hypothetical protein